MNKFDMTENLLIRNFDLQLVTIFLEYFSGIVKNFNLIYAVFCRIYYVAQQQKEHQLHNALYSM